MTTRDPAARVAHVRCGSDIRDALAAAGLAGDFVEASDPVCQGPVPGSLPPQALRQQRARFIADTWEAGTFTSVLQGLEREAEAVQALDRYERVVLWFEHDPYDQTILIRLLAGFLDEAALHDRLWLVCVDRYPGIARFVGLGQLSPAQLADLHRQARPVSAEQMALAAQVWAAYTGGDVDALWSCVAAGTPALPLLAGALRRLFQDLPWTGDGLALTERLSLRAVAEGANTPGQAFRRLYDSLEPMPFLGDLMYWPILQALAVAAEPALTRFESWRDPVSLTAFGRALLDGQADWTVVNGVDRWLGGVHVVGGGQVWRWDAELGRPVVA